MSDLEKEQMRQMVQKHAAALSEHFDSVRIFVTKHHGGDENTASYEFGKGNFYAQLGQVTEWIATQDQFQRNWAVRRDEEEK